MRFPGEGEGQKMTRHVFHPRRSAVWLTLFLAGCSASGARGQDGPPSAKIWSAFDVISIKPHPPGPGLSDGYGWNTSAKGFSATAIPLSSLIVLAYGLHTPDQIVSLPAWARDNYFDITCRDSWFNISANDDQQSKN
jgi:hypothetical protein